MATNSVAKPLINVQNIITDQQVQVLASVGLVGYIVDLSTLDPKVHLSEFSATGDATVVQVGNDLCVTFVLNPGGKPRKRIPKLFIVVVNEKYKVSTIDIPLIKEESTD